jgi:hypothetical protein
VASEGRRNQVHLERIQACLARSCVEQAVVGYQELTGGISGSHTYRVSLARDTVILKVTLAASEPGAAHSHAQAYDRARREVLFYRTLAQQIPLRLPDVLSSYLDDAFGCCLLLAAYRPAAPAEAWQPQDYDEVARQLAHFHARFWGATEALARWSWLRVLLHHGARTGSLEIERAEGAWRDAGSQPRLQGVFTGEAYRTLAAAFQLLPKADGIGSSFPTTLCHGDCHIGNLLCDLDGELVWADWQEVGLGRGPEDLSFLAQRARAAGGVVPEKRVMSVYQRCLEDETGQEIPLDGVQQVTDAFELRTLLLQWPFYLGYLSADQVSDLVERIGVLACRVSEH